MERLAEARRSSLCELLDGWGPDEHEELARLIQKLAKELLADDEKLLSEVHAAVA